jgi:hypothetical protein
LTPGNYAPDAFSQKLLLADDLMPLVRSRDKRVTVRAGNRDIKLGPLVLESTQGTEGACVVTVTRVSVSPLRLIPGWALAGGQRTVQAVAEEQQILQRYYPDITLMSEVTAIEFAYIGEVSQAAAA